MQMAALKERGQNCEIQMGFMLYLINCYSYHCNVPERFKNIVDRFGDNPEAMKQAGIAYATDQIIDLLANGVKHIHVYSMNKPDVAAGIQRNLSEILKA